MVAFAYMRVVAQNSERDIKARRVMEALAELAAQIMRIAAGGGDVVRLRDALEQLDQAISDMPSGSILLMQHEVAEALRFAPPVRPETDEERMIEYAIDDIARHSLRLVASRYQDLLTQERHARTGLFGAIKFLEDARERSRARHQPLSRKVPTHLVHLTMNQKQRRALKYLASVEGAEREATGRPSKDTLAELATAGLARKSNDPIGYSITGRGRDAHGHLLIDDAF